LLRKVSKDDFRIAAPRSIRVFLNDDFSAGNHIGLFFDTPLCEVFQSSQENLRCTAEGTHGIAYPFETIQNN
jgi:hypothetical protein